MISVTIISGLCCLISAFSILLQIKKIYSMNMNQYLKKFILIYASILVISAIHRLFNSAALITLVLGNSVLVGPFTDIGYALAGIVLAMYLLTRTNK